MIREFAKKHNAGLNKEFRYRGEEPGRVENFSDAVFALAITLLLISTSPPSDFNQIKKFAWDLIPFCFCITIIILIWYQHFIFYFRYGMRNPRVLLLNTIFLIIVLFYVYPLKFLTKGILIPIFALTGNKPFLNDVLLMFRGSNMADLMIIYGLGAMAVFFVLCAMYYYALTCADELDLDEIERFDTKTSMLTNFLLGLIPAISTLASILFYSQWYVGILAGFIYFLYPPVMIFYGKYISRKRGEILLQVQDNNGMKLHVNTGE